MTTLKETWMTDTWIQGALALMSTGAIVYLACTGRIDPQILASIVMVIIGFYFGSKQKQSQT